MLFASLLLPLLLQPFLTGEFLFPKEKVHNHSSMVVELPNGELFTVWYRGSGERTADDVRIMFSRRPKGAKTWTEPTVLADTPGFPDCNPTAFVDSKQRLWLIWPVIVANEWHTALLKYKVASKDYGKGIAPPKWDISEDLLFVPRNFAARSLEAIDGMRKSVEPGSQRMQRLDRLAEHAKDKYFSRMGWMPRAHPIELPSGRIIVPLYSDGYSYSIMAFTDDGGRTWQSSEPLPGAGNIQPSIARRSDGSLVAYMRDNGPPPKRMQMSESRDQGVTWSPVRDSEFPNPGAGTEVITLRDGRWAMIYNDTEKNRHSLAVSLSDDGGATWKWKRHLEVQEGGSFHYPSLIQAKDGTLHATYSHFTAEGKTIRHAHLNTAWVEAGDGR